MPTRRTRRLVPPTPLLTLAALTTAAVVATTAATPTPATAQDLPTIEEMTEGTTAMEGFFNLYWDDDAGALYWEIAELDTEFLYQISMGSGLGSNPVGIDRGQLRGTHVFEARRIGPRVLLVEPNYEFRAITENTAEARAVRDAFAPSVHWGFDIVARTGDRVLVDATEFFMRDARGVITQIEQRGQGSFQLDASRSAIYLPNTKSFPENTEVEAMLTFTSDRPGNLVSGVAATGSSFTVRQHHSFIQLPGPGYQPRVADPRIGVNGPTVRDYASPIDEDMRIRWVARHRLQKRDPDAERSEAVEPIVYYVDPGTPEPVRSALIEGAEWWAEAFEEAGFIDAYHVEVLPEGVDAQDIRYNMIHWTHRRTRGYSYGNSVIDPRTGEIVRGVVNLGSLRLRQDYLHGQGMVPPFTGGITSDDGGGYFDVPMSDEERAYWEACMLAGAPDFEYLAQVAGNSDAVEMALARVRQLSAHEVGHTLGFPHNYLSSTYGRESVMDYPAPLATIDDNGDIDLSDAYVPRIGTYDKLSVNWLYREFPEGTDERAALNEIVLQGIDDGLVFMMHTNNNFIGAAHPGASVWDNGANLVDHLKLEIDVREIGLEKFGTDVLRIGEPLSDLEYVLMPLYMHHRFQLRSAVQTLGGADYSLRAQGRWAEAVRHHPGRGAAGRAGDDSLDADGRLPDAARGRRVDDPARGLPPRRGRGLPRLHRAGLRPGGRGRGGGRLRRGGDPAPQPHGPPAGVRQHGRLPGPRGGRGPADRAHLGRERGPGRLPAARAARRPALRRRPHDAAGQPGRKRRRGAGRARRPAGAAGRGPGGDVRPVTASAPGGRRHPPLAAAHREHGPRWRARDAAG